MTIEKIEETAWRKGFIAACEWVMSANPSKAKIKSKVYFSKMMLK